MIPLPIDEHLPRIVEELRAHRAMVLVAEPGAGKTTRVPAAILAAGLLSSEHPNLVMLQPRRVAARAAAMRIAQERGWRMGEEVGYHVRFDRKIGARTRLRVVTEGILSRQMLEDPFIEDVGCVVLDEFHERSLHTDVAIALLREVRQSVREDLMLVVMSATLEAEPVAKFLGDCPIVRVPGRTFPVEIRHEGGAAGRIVEGTAEAIGRCVEGTRGGRGGRFESEAAEDPHPNPLPEYRARGKDQAVPQNLITSRASGNVLVFLPGAEEIRRVGDQISALAARENLEVFPLHGSLEAREQMAALAPSARRKIILATNIAETSLTIDGVSSVIDSGFARVAGYDAQRGLDRLDLKRISKASATQRAGCAGRTGPGVCVRLWSAKEDAELEAFELPEIKRVDLCGTVLSLHAWGSDPRKFGWFEAPDEDAIAGAERLLGMLGALSDRGQITELGKRILGLPVHPRLGCLLLFAVEEDLAEEGAGLAALLAEKDIAVSERGGDRHAVVRGGKVQGDSDLLVRLEMLGRAEREGFNRGLWEEGIDGVGARQVFRAREQFLRVVGREGGVAKAQARGRGVGDARTKVGGVERGVDRFAKPQAAGDGQGSGVEEKLLRVLLRAYPDRVCRRRAGDPLNGVMVGGGGVRLMRESVVTRGEFFLALDARQDDRSVARQSLVRIASRIEEEWLEEFFPQSIRRETAAVFDEGSQQVVGMRRVWYRDLLLKEARDSKVDAEEAGKVLGEVLKGKGREFVEAADGEQVMARVELLRQNMGEQQWPVFDEAGLGELIEEACRGRRSVEEVKRKGVAEAMGARLVYPLDRLLEQHAPRTIVVPTGNSISVSYQHQKESNRIVAVMEVRLQELFGWREVPRIAGGKVAVVLHLLGPNYRPVQVTDDLGSFWERTYPQVRKDLRARYPKHSWPEDPWGAKAEAKGKGRRSK